ncbi:MAG: hypothetical protein MK008_00665 [Bdellovibrionales bacterium]|nr:hypothetical protein [Bdellovibrionales bacterium]
MFKKLVGLFLLASVCVATVGCSDNDTQQHPNYGYGHGYADYDPYSSRYYRQDRYWDYRSERHQVHCVYDDSHSRYLMRKYRDYRYQNESCSNVNNFITTYNNYGFSPYYISSGCPTGYNAVYYGYSLFCAPWNYYNAWNTYNYNNSYLGFYSWWLGVGLYLAFN